MEPRNNERRIRMDSTAKNAEIAEKDFRKEYGGRITGFIFLPPDSCLESCSLLCALRAFAVNPVPGEPVQVIGMESGMILPFPFVAF